MRSEHSRSEGKKVELQKAVRQMYSQKKDKPGISRARIAKRAAFLWDIDGRQDGRDEYYWITAERQLRKEAALVTGSLVKVERKLEAALRWFKSLAIFEIFEVVGSVGIAVAIVSFISNQDIRHEQDVLTAWQTITSAQNQPGNGGRREAIEFLASRPLRFPWFCHAGEYPSCIVRHPSRDLSGLDVSVSISNPSNFGGGAYLAGIDLSQVRLKNANFRNAYLGWASFQDSSFWRVDLRNTDLESANLQGLSLRASIMQGASLVNTNIQNTDLRTADLKDINLEGAIYNDETIFPNDINWTASELQDRGLVHIDDIEVKLNDISLDELKRIHPWIQLRDL